jgi:hypothetical protein
MEFIFQQNNLVQEIDPQKETIESNEQAISIDDPELSNDEFTKNADDGEIVLDQEVYNAL